MFSGHHVCAKLISLQFMQTFLSVTLAIKKQAGIVSGSSERP
jgi:hypothetical protein